MSAVSLQCGYLPKRLDAAGGTSRRLLLESARLQGTIREKHCRDDSGTRHSSGRAEQFGSAMPELRCACSGLLFSFPAGTPILTPEGQRPIEQLREGDLSGAPACLQVKPERGTLCGDWNVESWRGATSPLPPVDSGCQRCCQRPGHPAFRRDKRFLPLLSLERVPFELRLLVAQGRSAACGERRFLFTRTR